MAIRNTAPQDLGRMAELDGKPFKEGMVLWRRFYVVGQARERAGVVSMGITDLERKIGDPPAHRLELHLIDMPKRIEGRARIKRACTVKSRCQAHVHAIVETGDKFALLTESLAGESVEARSRDDKEDETHRREILALSAQLGDLLANLHEAGVHGVHVHRDLIRVEDGHYHLDGFAHLIGEPRSAAADVEALSDLLLELGGEPTRELLTPRPRDARALAERFKQASNLDDGLGEFVLPTEPPFVGRLRALANLEEGLAQSQIAKPSTVVIRGERGVGKSRLLREFVAQRLEAKDSVVLVGSWQPQMADTRSGLLGALEQLTQVLPQLHPDDRDDIRRRINRAARHLGAIVARSAPALGTVLRPAEELPQLELGGDFARHTAVLADMFRAIGTRKRPLVLILDNVESADVSSAAVLEIIGQARPPHHTLVVLGLRTKVRGYKPEFPVENVDLEPLEEGEVQELLTRTLSGRVANASSLAQILWTISDGIPLALWATMRSWLERGTLSRGVSDGVWRARKSLRDEVENEPTVHDLFAERLVHLDEGVKRLVLQVAVLGIEVKDDAIAQLAEGIDSDRAIGELTDRGLLARTHDGVRFPHDSIRELVLESFDEEQRRAAHEIAAHLLTNQNAAIAQIVYHRDLAFDRDSASSGDFDKLSRLHIEAGRDRLDVYDLERARWHLERALEHSHDPEQRELAAEGLADICLLQDDLEAAISLYTAIIATSRPSEAVRVAAKAVQFLFSKSANNDARQLGFMALESANEPVPTTPLGKLGVLLRSIIGSWFGQPKIDLPLREALCRLYPYMFWIALIDDPMAGLMYIARSRWIARGLSDGSAAIVLSLEASLWTVLGRVKTAHEIFTLSNEMAQNAKDAWAQGMVFQHWGLSLLSLDRYTEGQDRLDDAIGAFRETGEMSIAIMSMFQKAMYGRDREHADVVLGWLEEGLNTARRNGKSVGVPIIQSVKLHVLARQGHPDLESRLLEHAQVIEHDEMPGIDRLLARVHLAYACLESAHLELALSQARDAQAQFGELAGAVPELCQEVHLVVALVLLAQPTLDRADRKKLRQSIRKFGKAAKLAPRLRVLNDLLSLKLATANDDSAKIRELASKIVSQFDVHENLHASRLAHRALARLLKGENVLAAAEHERLARNMGRRLGLSDHVLLSDFSEIEQEVGLLALSAENIEDSNHGIPAAGMLTAARPRDTPSGGTKVSKPRVDDQDDVLEAWALTAQGPRQTVLADILEPVRIAVGGSIDASSLEIESSNLDMIVPFESSDLEILLVNMLLTCRDAVGSTVKVTARLDDVTLREGDTLPRKTSPGRYLYIEVITVGEGSQVPVLSSFSTCETLVRGLGGVLNASADRGRVTLLAYLPLASAIELNLDRTRSSILIVHPDPAVRETLTTALDKLGEDWTEIPREEFNTSSTEGARVVFADGETLRDLRVLQPISDTRIIEIVKRGVQPVDHRSHTITIPFELSKLEELIGI